MTEGAAANPTTLETIAKGVGAAVVGGLGMLGLLNRLRAARSEGLSERRSAMSEILDRLVKLETRFEAHVEREDQDRVVLLDTLDRIEEEQRGTREAIGHLAGRIEGLK